MRESVVERSQQQQEGSQALLAVNDFELPLRVAESDDRAEIVLVGYAVKAP